MEAYEEDEEDGRGGGVHHTQRRMEVRGGGIKEVAYADEDGDGVQGEQWRRTRRRGGQGGWK